VQTLHCHIDHIHEPQCRRCLAAWLMARAAGIADGRLDVVPLFETVGDLEAAEGVMKGLLERPNGVVCLNCAAIAR
jgi:phosphoenolpyruvate carboxylase